MPNPTSAGNAPGRQSTPELAPQPTPQPPAHTKPPLSRLPATLLRPLTKAGRQVCPFYYLSRRPTRIAPAPIGSPLAEKMRRRVEGAAIALWWPIGKVLTLFFLWRDPPSRRAVLAWWQALEAAPHNPPPAPASTSSAEPSSTPSPAPPPSTKHPSPDSNVADEAAQALLEGQRVYLPPQPVLASIPTETLVAEMRRRLNALRTTTA